MNWDRRECPYPLYAKCGVLVYQSQSLQHQGRDLLDVVATSNCDIQPIGCNCVPPRLHSLHLHHADPREGGILQLS